MTKSTTPAAAQPDWRTGALLDHMTVVRDLPTLSDRLLYLAVAASNWRRVARTYVGPLPLDVPRWEFYAAYLESVASRIMATAYARHVSSVSRIDAASYAKLRGEERPS